MRAIVPLTLILAACAADLEPAALPVDAAALPELTHVALGTEPGTTATFRVDGAGYGERVYLIGSLDGEGAGRCPAFLGGACFGLQEPTKVLAMGIADADGRALLDVEVPASTPLGTELTTQAVVVRGRRGADSLLSAPVTSVATATPDTVSWSITGLSDLGPDYVYENWLIVDGAAISAGRYAVVGGAPASTMFSVDGATAALAAAFVVTIEPVVDPDPGPSATHVLAGDFVDGTAALTVDHPAALGTDFTAATGSYFLETPTSAAVADDFRQGVWFLDPATGTPSLDLPVLPDGWAYEGWAVVGGMPLSLGRFLDPAGPDDDAGGPAAGPDAAPPFPGQDFVMPPYDLTAGAIVISVEPEPDNGGEPYTLKPLLDGTVEDLGAGVLQDLANNAEASNPVGSAWFE